MVTLINKLHGERYRLAEEVTGTVQEIAQLIAQYSVSVGDKELNRDAARGSTINSGESTRGEGTKFPFEMSTSNGEMHAVAAVVIVTIICTTKQQAMYQWMSCARMRTLVVVQ